MNSTMAFVAFVFLVCWAAASHAPNISSPGMILAVFAGLCVLIVACVAGAGAKEPPQHP